MWHSTFHNLPPFHFTDTHNLIIYCSFATIPSSSIINHPTLLSSYTLSSWTTRHFNPPSPILYNPKPRSHWNFGFHHVCVECRSIKQISDKTPFLLSHQWSHLCSIQFHRWHCRAEMALRKSNIILGNKQLLSQWRRVWQWLKLLLATFDCSSAASFHPRIKETRFFQFSNCSGVWLSCERKARR